MQNPLFQMSRKMAWNNSTNGNPTYSLTSSTKDKTLQKYKFLLLSFGVSIKENEKNNPPSLY